MVGELAERLLSRFIDWGITDRVLLGRGMKQWQEMPLAWTLV